MGKEILEVAEGLQYQSADEQRVYGITTTKWGSDPSTSSVKAFDEGTNTDVTSTVIPGSSSEDGDVITLPALRGLTAGHTYRVEVKFTIGSDIEECCLRVNCPW